MTLIGDKIRRIRSQRGLTMAQLAAAVKVSTVTIHNIERGGYDPKFGTLREICRALNLPMSYLITDERLGLFLKADSGEKLDFRKTGIISRRALPDVSRMGIEAGGSLKIPFSHGLMVVVHLLSGSVDAALGERGASLAPGDTLFVELFDELTFTAEGASSLLIVSFPPPD